MVKQFSVDIVVPDDEDFTEKDLDRCITSYAYAEHKNWQCIGYSWRATWFSQKAYEKGFGPDESD